MSYWTRPLTIVGLIFASGMVRAILVYLGRRKRDGGVDEGA